ncbi:MAG: hypothetical protein CVU56_07180 [Deltaproteobacteria bacterium HGW-Deltaproteobacteria-14]|jgi:murein DD-endopeptidase MepM/ murein hydrolase activator NlpD|nr:MAG: hypothetical protein CVU56_07180 [Deltaproteobacteria bacterium HGW-Deltaproteobacteria-14]
MNLRRPLALLVTLGIGLGPTAAAGAAPEEDDDDVAVDVASDDDDDALAARPADPERYGPFHLKNGLVLPYPLDKVFRGFADCRRGRHRHPALDIGGVGPSWGLGTPVRSMARARVVRVGAPEDDPERWGTRLTTAEKVRRGNRWLPTSAELPDYGRVWFFTSDYGRSRTGVFITTRVLDGRLEGHTITYMHLAAVYPGIAVGDVVEAGQEIGALGGTAVLESAPHVHVSIHNRRDRALDVGPILGIGPTAAQCRRGKRGERALRARYSRNAVKLMAELRRDEERTATRSAAPTSCGSWTYEGAFEPGDSVVRHRVLLPPAEGAATITVERTDALRTKWRPKLELRDAWGTTLWSGSKADRADVRRFGLKGGESGRRRKPAALTVAPPEPTALAVVVTAWGKGWPPPGARYRLTVTRPCAAP